MILFEIEMMPSLRLIITKQRPLNVHNRREFCRVNIKNKKRPFLLILRWLLLWFAVHLINAVIPFGQKGGDLHHNVVRKRC